jgi:hypothetical protein
MTHPYDDPMKAQNERDERTISVPKAPYTRPELKRVGTLRDVTAGIASGIDD